MRATVAFNRRISTAYRHLGVAAPGFPANFGAGQFVMVRSPWVGDPFLPRAFSIYRVARPAASGRPHAPGPVVEILYKVLGKGTQCLARMEAGQEVDLLGPLGNSFAPPAPGDLALLVAGGIGVPPIAALAAQFRNSKFQIRNLDVFLGGKTSEDILCVKDFEEAGARVHLATEDGSLGACGLVTDLLDPFLSDRGDQGSWQSGNQEESRAPAPPRPRARSLRLYACGPPGMLVAVARLAARRHVPCQVSVEANMACGFGACMGCATEVQDEARGYKLVCKDGPVFDSREIRW